MIWDRPGTSDGASRELLVRACARNGPVDLFDENEEHVGKSRLLAIREEEVLIERPVRAGRLVALGPRTELIVHLLQDGNRWSFRTRMLDRKRVRLNSEVIVDAVALQVPTVVCPNQRRRYYRVSTAAEEMVCFVSQLPDGWRALRTQPEEDASEPASVCDPAVGGVTETAETERQAEPDAPPLITAENWLQLCVDYDIPVTQAQVVNLSEGGMAIAYDRWKPLIPTTGEIVRVRLDLGDAGGPLLFDAEVRHRRLIQRPERFVVGLRFYDFLQPPDTVQAVTLIGRLVTAMQRQQLARLRRRC